MTSETPGAGEGAIVPAPSGPPGGAAGGLGLHVQVWMVPVLTVSDEADGPLTPEALRALAQEGLEEAFGETGEVGVPRVLVKVGLVRGAPW